jgi:carboxymethylenebutenolidase
VIEFEADIDTPDGRMNAVVMHPEEGGPYPVAICLMDSCGIRPDFLEMPRRMAVAGYCVVTPNVYYRKLRHLDLDPNRIDFDDTYDDGRKLMWELNQSVTSLNFARDTRALLSWLDKFEPALRGPVGAFGYCLGGRLALAAAAHVPERVAAAACFHGGGFVKDTPDSVHLHAGKIKAEIYVGHAGTDKHVPEEQLFGLQRSLKEAGVRGRIELYGEAHHGFTIPGRRVYHERSANRCWERLFALFGRNLPQAPANGFAPRSDAEIVTI